MIKDNKLYSLAVLLLLIISSCFIQKKAPVTELMYPLPGTVQLADNFHCDETEITNMDYREYLFWIKSIHGLNSEKYKLALPDTLCWNELDTCLELYSKEYLRYPAYLSNPVVGISSNQANLYSQWRSDRVFQGMLIQEGIISWSADSLPENCFTIEKYFKGEYQNIQYDTTFLYYPNYRLPTLEERSIILNYADSVENDYFKDYNSKFCKECKSELPYIHSDMQPRNISNNTITKGNSVHCLSKIDNPLLHIRGNVSELSNTEGISFGGGWIDKREQILKQDTFIYIKPNCWTGFRNVCEWKKWKN